MADWAFFMKNGTDATTFSILTARAFTGKKTMFLRGYYHGNDPWAMKADHPGVLPEEVANNLVVPWFDLPAMEAAYDACGGDVAAPHRPALRPRQFRRQPLRHQGILGLRPPSSATSGHRPSSSTTCAPASGWTFRASGPLLGLQGGPHLAALANGYNMSAVCGWEHLEGHRPYLLHRLLG